MAAVARLSSRALRSSISLTRILHFSSSSAAALQTEAPPPSPAKRITESPDRIKWDYREQRKIIPLGQWNPKIAVDAYVAPNVVLAGQVTVWDGASLLNGAVLRGDLNKITVGFCSNVQEKCVLHAAWSSPTGVANAKLVSNGKERVELVDERTRCLIVEGGVLSVERDGLRVAADWFVSKEIEKAVASAAEEGDAKTDLLEDQAGAVASARRKGMRRQNL